MVTSVSRIFVMTRSKRRSYWPACHCRVTIPGRGGMRSMPMALIQALVLGR